MDRSPEVNASIRVLLEQCPDLKSRWEEERRDRGDTDTRNPLAYMQAAALAEVVVETYQSGRRDCLGGLFGELERLLTTEDHPDRELLIVGFIEDLQGTIGWSGLDAEEFYRVLGPKSRAKWDGMSQFWRDVNAKKLAGQLPGPFDSSPHVDDPRLRKIIRGLYRPPQ